MEQIIVHGNFDLSFRAVIGYFRKFCLLSRIGIISKYLKPWLVKKRKKIRSFHFFHQLRNLKLATRHVNVNTVPSFHIGTVDVSVTNSQFIRLYDCHNGIDFIIDTASPKSIVPIHMFPSLQNNNISCELLSADGHPLQEAGNIDLRSLILF